jgi:hypothetical protein
MSVLGGIFELSCGSVLKVENPLHPNWFGNHFARVHNIEWIEDGFDATHQLNLFSGS